MRFCQALCCPLPPPRLAFLYSALSLQLQITAQRLSLVSLPQFLDLLNCRAFTSVTIRTQSPLRLSKEADAFSLHRSSIVTEVSEFRASAAAAPECILSAKMMSVTDFFYGAREPVWIVHTPQSAMKSYVAGTPPYISATPQTPQTVNTRGHRTSHTEGIQHTTVELKVPLCCEACEERVKHSLLNFNGVESVRCDTLKQRVTVTGTAAPADLLKICKKLHKRSELLSGNTSTGKRVKNIPASVASSGGWTWNSGWSRKNTPAAISAWQ